MRISHVLSHLCPFVKPRIPIPETWSALPGNLDLAFQTHPAPFWFQDYPTPSRRKADAETARSAQSLRTEKDTGTLPVSSCTVPIFQVVARQVLWGIAVP
jgi:hypothetical protein